jgi:hypothetical protein
MQFDVAQAQASQDPRAYSSRWTVQSDGTVVPRIDSAGHNVAPSLLVTPGENGQMNVALPQLATGTALPWATASSGGTQYPLMNLAAPPESNVWGDSEYFGMWDTVLDQRDGKWNIRRAIRWWHRDPLIYKCTKLLCQLANSRVTFKSDDEEAKQLVELWFEQAMPNSFMCQFFLEYFRTGYVPILKSLIPYQPRNYKPGKVPKLGSGSNVEERFDGVPRMQASLSETPDGHNQATASLMERNKEWAEEYKQALGNYEKLKTNFEQRLCSEARLDKARADMQMKQYRFLKGMVAGGYTILDPLLVDLKGPQSMQWLREPYLQISGDVIAAVMSPSALQKVMLDKLPVEIVQQIRDGATYVWLSPNICSIVTHDKQPYERYPTPMMRHCFDALEMKYDIAAMDTATVRGIKNRILLVKIGNDTYPVTDPHQIAHVASLYNSIGRTGTFFWSHAIEMEWIEPDMSSFDNPEKYRHVNDEIRTVYGVGYVLTGTSESGNIGNNVMNFKGIEQEVHAAQNAFLEFLNKEIRLLKASLSISADIQIDFDRLNLKDEVQFWQVICQAVMNGIIDHQTALETLGFHFPEIKDRMATMKPLKKQGLFLPSPSANNLGPDGQMKQQGAGGKPGGPSKKPGKNKSKTNKSQPKKKAKASMQAVGEEIFIRCDAEEFDDEMREDVAKLYDTRTDHVLTTAEFQQKFPDIDLSPEWPELNPLETVGATMAASRVLASINIKYDAMVSSFKVGTDSTRGPYLTPQKKQEFRRLALAEATAEHIKEIAKVDKPPKKWTRIYDNTKGGLQNLLIGVDAEVLDAHAVAMCSLRLKKSMK